MDSSKYKKIAIDGVTIFTNYQILETERDTLFFIPCSAVHLFGTLLDQMLKTEKDGKILVKALRFLEPFINFINSNTEYITKIENADRFISSVFLYRPKDNVYIVLTNRLENQYITSILNDKNCDDYDYDIIALCYYRKDILLRTVDTNLIDIIQKNKLNIKYVI